MVEACSRNGTGERPGTILQKMATGEPEDEMSKKTDDNGKKNEAARPAPKENIIEQGLHPNPGPPKAGTAKNEERRKGGQGEHKNEEVETKRKRIFGKRSQKEIVEEA